MSLRTVLLSALGAATVWSAAGAGPAEPRARNEAAPSPRHERLAQAKRDEEEKSDSGVPGGLPGRSDKPDDAIPDGRRGFAPPRAKPSEKGKGESSKEGGAKAKDNAKKSPQ